MFGVGSAGGQKDDWNERWEGPRAWGPDLSAGVGGDFGGPLSR